MWFGTWKAQAALCPLFAAFGPEPVKARMEIAGAKAVVTTARLFKRKVEPVLADLPTLKHVILVGGSDGGTESDAMIKAASPDYEIPPTDPQELSTLHFTSGTTGRPKEAMHVHEAVVAHRVSARYALDLKPDYILWCTADPGWVTGTSYGIIAPLSLGCTMLSDEEEFDAER